MTASQPAPTLEPMSTIELPDDVAAALTAAAAERGVSVDELAAETISARFGPKRRTLSFVGAGRSGSGRGGAEAEQLLEEGGFLALLPRAQNTDQRASLSLIT